MSTICTSQARRRFLHWSIAVLSVNNVLSEIGAYHDYAFLQFVNSVYSALVDTLLHHSPHHVVNWIEVGAVRWP